MEKGKCCFFGFCERASSLPALWQNQPGVVSELDQHVADFRGGSFPLSIVASYSHCGKKKGESGAWRRASTSPRKKAGRFSSPAWTKPDPNEDGKGRGRATWSGADTQGLVSACKCTFSKNLFVLVSGVQKNLIIDIHTPHEVIAPPSPLPAGQQDACLGVQYACDLAGSTSWRSGSLGELESNDFTTCLYIVITIVLTTP